ncbi:hypothetical protein [Cellulomonas sp. SLBN-39]|uniref:hypothetical protein n=1 Tax=Cellulomonas sp. SLBN-39 TaxID=2768446 RepID=UPI00114D7A68|nr:hypothetical protein [Cellulomonas sp. SLBN-39]TQL02894.1 hypothetical protein FBY24_1981 [Cellulomonas sp. SLBN-39]
MIRKRLTAALVAVATCLGAGATVVATSTAASAWPQGCSILAHQTSPADGRVSLCTAGTGTHRIVLVCNQGRIYDTPDYKVYGAWKPIGSPSATSCFSGKTGGFYRSAYIEKSG